MLVYHPAYDIYHTTYRILSILKGSEKKCLETERVRMYDFVLLFPHELRHIKLPVGTTEIRRKFKETPYNKVPNRKKVFHQIQFYFELAAQCLVSYGALELECYQQGLLCKTEKFEEIINQIDQKGSTLNQDVLTFISDVFSKIEVDELRKRFY